MIVANRYLLKLSGEVLKGDQSAGISIPVVEETCQRLVSIIEGGAQLGIVIGGGNIFRGASGEVDGFNRITGDQIGMLATVLNGLSIVERFQKLGVEALLQSAIQIDGVVDLFNRSKIEDTFKAGGVVVFCAGLGNPYFSTDTTAAIRGLQIDADVVLKATKVDGVYDKDPVKYQDAKKFDTISYDEVLRMELGIMDLSAMALLRKHKKKLQVFDMSAPGMLEKACSGEIVGTLVE
jgi:uridylate kinase